MILLRWQTLWELLQLSTPLSPVLWRLPMLSVTSLLLLSHLKVGGAEAHGWSVLNKWLKWFGSLVLHWQWASSTSKSCHLTNDKNDFSLWSHPKNYESCRQLLLHESCHNSLQKQQMAEAHWIIKDYFMRKEPHCHCYKNQRQLEHHYKSKWIVGFCLSCSE